MAILPSLRNLLIPNKTKQGADYQTDMQQLEIWARQPIQKLVAGSGITLSPSNGQATDSKGQGPHPITISAPGAAGITSVGSPLVSIAVTNPTGPTVDIEVAGIPFLNTANYADANHDVAYGQGASSGGTPGGEDTAIGYNALHRAHSDFANTGVGYSAGSNITTGLNNTIVGAESIGPTTGSDNTVVGEGAMISASTAGSNTVVGTAAGNNIAAGANNTYIGTAAGPASDVSNATALGTRTVPGGNGAVAIGRDSSGTPASTSNANDFVLGTANHVVVFSNLVLAGTNTTNLGSNSPAAGASPAAWIKVRLGAAGAIGYIPVWQ